jgi:hypothetical protein
MTRLITALILAAAFVAAEPAASLGIAVVQVAVGPTLEANRDRITGWIQKAVSLGARVVVFPEGALSSRSDAPEDDVEGAVRTIRNTVRANRVYALLGGWTWSARIKRAANWMKVIGPDGRELLHYDKLWDIHDAPGPAIFQLDGSCQRHPMRGSLAPSCGGPSGATRRTDQLRALQPLRQRVGSGARVVLVHPARAPQWCVRCLGQHGQPRARQA